MAFAFDTLAYAKRLRESGIPQPQAEAHAEAAREYIMVELVTKTDLTAALEAQTLRLTVRMGTLLFLAVGGLGALLKLTS